MQYLINYCFKKCLREAAEKNLFLVAGLTKNGGGVKTVPKAIEKLNMFCLRRHIQKLVLLLVYYDVGRQTHNLSRVS